MSRKLVSVSTAPTNSAGTAGSAKNAGLSSDALAALSLLAGGANGAMLGGGGLFNSLLAQNQDDGADSDNGAAGQSQASSLAASASVAQTQTRTLTDHAGDPAAGSQSATQNASEMLDAWRHFVDKWHAAQRKAAASAAVQNAAQAAASAAQPAPGASVTATTAVIGATGITAGSQTSATGGADPTASTAGDLVPDAAQMLAALQGVMQSLQQQLQARQTAAAAGPATVAGAANAVTGELTTLQNTGKMLGDLLKLARALGQAGAAATPNTAAMTAAMTAPAAPLSTAGTTTASAVAPTLDALATSLLGDVKTILDGLAKAADQTAATAAIPTTAATNAAGAADPATAPGPLLQTALTAADAAMKQLVAAFTPTFAPAPASAAPAPLTATALTALSAPTAAGATAGFDSDNGAGTAGDDAASSDTAGTFTAFSAFAAGKAAPYSFASQLSLDKTAASAGGLPSAVEQVMLQLSRNVKSGNDQMSLQLHPADLGTITIKLSIAKDGTVSGTVTASSQATLDLMQKDAKGLERALQEAGLSPDSAGLQFSLGDQSNQSQRQGNGTALAHDYWQQQATNAATASATAAGLDEATATRVYYLTRDSVNMTV